MLECYISTATSDDRIITKLPIPSTAYKHLVQRSSANMSYTNHPKKDPTYSFPTVMSISLPFQSERDPSILFSDKVDESCLLLPYFTLIPQSVLRETAQVAA